MTPLTPPASVMAAGDSSVQREAERVIIETLGRELGVTFTQATSKVVDGAVLKFDGVCEEPPVLVEAWAHQGRARAAEKHKLMVDALRLAWAGSALYPAGNVQKILALADDEAAAHLVGRSWMKAALEHLGVMVHVVKIPDDLRQRIRDAQRRQFR
ncbi:MAG: hypothetical protein ABSG37_12890 [Candidatus Limnocylindrales bacterium]|jgi:hypothetical protein